MVDYHSIIHFRFLNHNHTLNADLYSQELQHVHENLLTKCHTLVNRRKVVLFYDSARQYSVKIIQENILDLCWSVLPHPPYSALNNFHLFSSQQNALNDKKFCQNQVKILEENFFSSKSTEFYLRKSISNLINDKRWFKIMANILLIEIHC